jgi:hypothetical protein
MCSRQCLVCRFIIAWPTIYEGTISNLDNIIKGFIPNIFSHYESETWYLVVPSYSCSGPKSDEARASFRLTLCHCEIVPHIEGQLQASLIKRFL